MIRLSVAVILLLISLLVLVKAPLNVLWLVDVLITNFPCIFLLLAIISFITAINQPGFKAVILLCSAIAFILYSLPIVFVYWRGKNLEKELSNVFPSTQTTNQLAQPFSFIKMFTGIGTGKINYQTITYKSLPGLNLSMDFYPSSEAKKSPIVIVIHGGSWESGDSKQLPALNNYLAARGYNVAAINYRLAPQYKFPAPVEDVKDVIAYLKLHEDQLNIDTSDCVLLGRSAGAEISLVAAYSLHDKNIKGAISFYGPNDMVWGAQIKSNKLVLNTDQIYRDYLGGLYSEVPQKFKESSPYEYVDASSTPTLIIHGDVDALVSHGHSERLAAKLNEVNVKNYFLSLPFQTHGLDYNINGPGGQITTFAVERFLNSVTK